MTPYIKKVVIEQDHCTASPAGPPVPRPPWDGFRRQPSPENSHGFLEYFHIKGEVGDLQKDSTRKWNQDTDFMALKMLKKYSSMKELNRNSIYGTWILSWMLLIQIIYSKMITRMTLDSSRLITVLHLMNSTSSTLKNISVITPLWIHSSIVH